MVEAFVKRQKVFFGESARCTGLEASETGFFVPDAKQAEIDSLAGINPLFIGVKLFVAVADLIRGAVGQAHGFRAIGRDLPKIEFVVEDDGGVILGPTGDAEGRLLLDRKVGFAINESRWSAFGDVDDGVRGGVDGPIVVVAEIEEIAAAGAFFKIVIVVEAVLDFGAGARGDVDKRNVSGGTAYGALHSVSGPVVGDGERLVLKRSDALVQIFAKGDGRVFGEEPGGWPVFL